MTLLRTSSRSRCGTLAIVRGRTGPDWVGSLAGASFYRLLSGLLCLSMISISVGEDHFSVPSTWVRITTQDGLPHDSVRAVRCVGDSLWVATDAGVTRGTNGLWELLRPTQGTWPDFVPSDLDIDPKTRDVWIGTLGGGLLRYTAGRIDRFDQFNSGLAGDLVFSVRVYRDEVWAATNGGISVYDPIKDVWTLYHPRRADTGATIATSLPAADEAMYAQLWRGTVERFDPVSRQWIRLFQPDQTGHEGGALASALSDRALWIATQESLYQVSRADSWGDSPGHQLNRRLDHLESAIGFPLTMAADSERIWVGTEKGLFVLSASHRNVWFEFRGEHNRGNRGMSRHASDDEEIRFIDGEVPRGIVRSLAISNETLWVGTSRGLFRGSRLLPWEQLSVVSNAEGQRESTTSESGRSAVPVDQNGALNQAENTGEPVIAIYGPRNRTIALPGAAAGPAERGRPDIAAIESALERHNELWASRGLAPIQLEYVRPGYAGYGWGLPEDDLARFSRIPRVAGVIAYLDDLQLAAEASIVRLELPCVNIALGELKELPDTRLRNPWVFPCVRDPLSPSGEDLKLDGAARLSTAAVECLTKAVDESGGDRSAVAVRLRSSQR